ncbi:hypothetical protein E1267_09070 [Nonomuraea longispora]|uniref:Rad50/SbcC-type AAA domain-containing protein n=1 Tax=Nonomuraea longispora TaxID=1848320 RepID=A0A4R4NJL7_9ACTN|nr:AAA family ATPase [Nonomuraea longispora]TDC08844.1 hypothetical protein E1267_09070 [Nonomuraea longispora]
MRESLRRLYFACVYIARSKHLSPGIRFAALRLAEEAGKSTRIPKQFRQEIEKRISDFLSRSVAEAWEGFLAITKEECISLIAEARKASLASPKFIITNPEVDPESQKVSTADLLASAVDRQHSNIPQSENVYAAYDMSDSNVRLQAIELRGFRGSPSELSLDFASKGSPVSAIIFGENGVGKSTIVDAIEFALQGRIGRSAYFDSPLTPAIGSLAQDALPWTKASLADGTQECRSLVDGAENLLIASPDSIRPGFRLAPITIKRADILRFLDTESLERGSVLLDYFPADTESLAVRPEEESLRLRSKMADLRIRRSAYAKTLAEIVNVSSSELASMDGLKRYISTNILRGESHATFEKRNGWMEVDRELRLAISNLSQTMGELRRLKKRSESTLQSLNPVVHAPQTRIIREVLKDVGDDVSHAFSELASEHPIDSIDIVYGESGPLSLDIVVRLQNGRNCFPQQLFSEAYRDLLALLFFMSVAKKASERGQARILIIDDVLQSVDAKIRHSLINYMLTAFADWQLIFTVHDRLWCEQLKDLFNAHRHAFVERRILSWNFEAGPQMAQSNADSMTKDLRAIMACGEPRVVGAIAGQLLESICDQLSWRLQLKIARKKGDRYTLGDLWPAVKERLENSRVNALAQKISTHRGMRNLTVHADPLSMGLSTADAQSFAQAIIDLYGHVRCGSCSGWIVGGSRSASCSCGTTTI